jgi:GT2 family glycosyltransferase
MRIFLCIVNYRTDAALVRYLESVRTAGRESVGGIDICIVDNSLRPQTERESFARDVCNAFGAAVEVVFPSENLGYFGALPIAQERARVTRPDCVIYSNADLLLDRTFFRQLNAAVACNAAVIAPAILTEQGRGFDQNPKHLMRYDLKNLLFLRFVYSNAVAFRTYIWLGKLKESMRSRRASGVRAVVQANEARAIYAPHGALFIFAKPDFFASLPRHEPFLYGEELLVGEEALRQGEEVRYVPAIRVYDTRHASTGSLSATTRRRLLWLSIDFIVRNYYPGQSRTARTDDRPARQTVEELQVEGMDHGNER